MPYVIILAKNLRELEDTMEGDPFPPFAEQLPI